MVADRQERMSRAARTARGSAGALLATVFAAASHALAGGAITVLAILATALLALPLCVALAGRIGSLWRLGTAVMASQFLYHWCFAGLGFTRSGPADLEGGPHAAHLALARFAPDVGIDLGGADLWMWASHLVAAIATTALMYRGEQAALAMTRVMRSVLPVITLPAAGTMSRPLPLVPLVTRVGVGRRRLASLSAISHRGPPGGFLLPCR